MKIRTDYVSNSSSSSFIISNPKSLVVWPGPDKTAVGIEAIQLLRQANYIYFVVTDEDFKRLKDRVESAFGKTCSCDYDEFCEDSQNICLDSKFYDEPSDEKDEILKELCNCSKHMTVDFGDCYDEGGKSVQAATLLDYIFGAEIEPEDHFEYDPISKIGIERKV